MTYTNADANAIGRWPPLDLAHTELAKRPGKQHEKILNEPQNCAAGRAGRRKARKARKESTIIVKEDARLNIRLNINWHTCTR